jgi:2-C-methyl-D-erythritol 4-phosphate cytidylyltransferase
MPRPPRCFALVPCAGVGQRAGTVGPKQYSALAGQAVVAHTLAALAAVPRLHAILVVLAPDDAEFERQVPQFKADEAEGGRFECKTMWIARCGGDSRAASVSAGLQVLREKGALDTDWVLVHDAARCLLQPQWVVRLIDACADDSIGGLLALPLADTLKAADAQGRVTATLPRANKWLAQTPQMFRLGRLQEALVHADAHGVDVTDEASAIEALGFAPLLVPGDQENFKLTWPGDFSLALRLLTTREAPTH